MKRYIISFYAMPQAVSATEIAVKPSEAPRPRDRSLRFGLMGRRDDECRVRRHDQNRVMSWACDSLPFVRGLCAADRVSVAGVGNTKHWLSWFRSVLGLREEYALGEDRSLITGFTGPISLTILQQKGSLTFGPWVGGAELRWPGPYPLLADNSPPEFKETNLVIDYEITDKMKVQLSVYNLLDTTVYASQSAYTHQVSRPPRSKPERPTPCWTQCRRGSL
jgi:hypothetical protein